MTTHSRDLYEVLGVARDASTDQIKSAYRKLALKHHPDRNPGDRNAEERFKEAAEAYGVLGDPEKRRRYDTYGHAGLSGGAGGFDPSIFADFSDILGDFFGFGDVFGGGRRRGADDRNGAGRDRLGGGVIPRLRPGDRGAHRAPDAEESDAIRDARGRTSAATCDRTPEPCRAPRVR